MLRIRGIEERLKADLLTQNYVLRQLELLEPQANIIAIQRKHNRGLDKPRYFKETLLKPLMVNLKK